MTYESFFDSNHCTCFNRYLLYRCEYCAVHVQVYIGGYPVSRLSLRFPSYLIHTKVGPNWTRQEKRQEILKVLGSASRRTIFS